jgi:diazepam-binding inhibitor (GABA receptor modulator, acyl-CoA-binding protein)
MAHQNELEAAFVQAQLLVNSLAERPDNASMLKLYALFKQGSKGFNTTPVPSGFDFLGKTKHAAWLALGTMSQDQAKQEYVETVKALTA